MRDPRHVWKEKELLRAIDRDAEPGAFRDSSSDYILLGAMLRRTGHRRTGLQLHGEILGALDLDHTSLGRDPVVGRRFVGGSPPANHVWGELFSDAGMAGTAPDVARFFDALLVEKKVLEPRTLERMLQAGPSPNTALGISRVSYAPAICRADRLLRRMVDCGVHRAAVRDDLRRAAPRRGFRRREGDAAQTRRRLQAKGDIDC